MRDLITVRGLLVAFLAITSTLLLAATFVLGVTGDAGATTWTGAAGIVLLAMWLVVGSRPRRASYVKAGRAVAGHVPGGS
jgi:hypothetical protein